MTLEQALARLDHALAELAGSRDGLAAAFDQAISATLTCVIDLEHTLRQAGTSAGQQPGRKLTSAA